MRFSPGGTVHACCANDVFPLGSVERSSILELWQGERIAQLRAALAAGDYSLGCDDCGVEHELGHRDATPAAMYDRFPEGVSTWPRRLEFALSNRCNLECVHCNGDLSSTIRAKRDGLPPLPRVYDDRFFAQLPPFLDHVEEVIFIGGEPFLIPEAWRVWELMVAGDHRPDVHVTTNGTMWNDRIEAMIHELRMNVAVSIDAVDGDAFEAIRVGASHQRVVEVRDRFIAATRSYGGSFCLNHCLLLSNATRLAAFLLDADELDVDVHVIPVFYPPELGLFRLPPAELRSMLASMESELEQSGRSLGRNRPAWDGVVALIRSHLDHEATEVSITPRWSVEYREPPRPVDPRLAIEAADELAAWSSGGIIEIRTVEDLVVEIVAPDWAAALGLAGHRGRPPDDLSVTLAPHGTVVGATHAERDQIGFAELRLELLDGSVGTVRAVVLQSEEHDQQRILVGVDAPMAGYLSSRC